MTDVAVRPIPAPQHLTALAGLAAHAAAIAEAAGAMHAACSATETAWNLRRAVLVTTEADRHADAGDLRRHLHSATVAAVRGCHDAADAGLANVVELLETVEELLG
ncbi:MAG: hypothetical protein M5U14_07525 [Acidimicrobiia bacterium]|nr:hypothetical protein [Acidimicrobiia bacterium]